MTLPSELYKQKVLSGAIQDDIAQRKIIDFLDHLYTQITQITQLTLITRMQRWLKLQPIKGLYLWGGVGRGKTFLVDLFYEALPNSLALRMHFHRFMQTVHESLTKFQGQVNPLKLVALEFMQYKVLIFDEFYVTDITDAMLLGNLLQELLKKGMILIATSNTAPDALYLNGLQRNKFLPAIAAIKKHCALICLDSKIDYRTQILSKIDFFYYPASDKTEKILHEIFIKLAAGTKLVNSQKIKINEREIITKMHTANIIWFDFNQLCATNRSVSDYMQLAKLYNIILISNVPIFNEHNQDSARRFIELIDELYDHKIKLIMSLQTNVHHLAQDYNNLAFERTISRLNEMNTQEYMQFKIK